MTERQLIAHLLRRAGFGCTPAELELYLDLGFEGSVARLVDYESVDNSQLEADLTARAYDLTRLDGIQNWWLHRMVFTARPLEEKMTLFWHGHLTSTNNVVGRPPYMLSQNQLYRESALGRFQELVLKASQDPAMLVFLDGRLNGRRRPNENYARELMELFTLGIGNYTEQDVREAARALTGWTVRDDRFYFNVSNHDPGTKTILGQIGSWNGTDVVRIVCEHPACAPFVCRKLIRFFLTDAPSAELVGRIAGVFLGSRGNVRETVRAILLSPEFRSDASHRALVKSPVEFLVGAMKALQISGLPSDFRNTLRLMQQELFNPPGVEGWDGGQSWLSTTTYLHRANFINRLTSGNDPNRQPFVKPVEMVQNAGLATHQQIVDYFVERLLDGQMSAAGKRVLLDWLAPTTSRTQLKRLRGLLHLILTSPTYQLN